MLELGKEARPQAKARAKALVKARLNLHIGQRLERYGYGQRERAG